MISFSIQSRDRIFVKTMDLCLLLKTSVKILLKI